MHLQADLVDVFNHQDCASRYCAHEGRLSLDHVISVSLVFEAQIVCTLSQLVTERKYSFELGKMHLLIVISVNL